jgi:hypothetical protein
MDRCFRAGTAVLDLHGGRLQLIVVAHRRNDDALAFLQHPIARAIHKARENEVTRGRVMRDDLRAEPPAPIRVAEANGDARIAGEGLQKSR